MVPFNGTLIPDCLATLPYTLTAQPPRKILFCSFIPLQMPPSAERLLLNLNILFVIIFHNL